MVDDKEFAEFGREFVCDDRFRSLTASRFAWNAFRAASDIFGVHVEKEGISAATRDRDVVAMLNDKASVVPGPVEGPKAGCLF